MLLFGRDQDADPTASLTQKGVRTASLGSGVQVSDMQAVVEVPGGQTSHMLSLGFVPRREKPTGFLSAPLAKESSEVFVNQ